MSAEGDFLLWNGRITKRPDGRYRENFTFPGLSRSRRSLGTSDRDEAIRKVRDNWEILEHRARQRKLLAEGVITKEQVNDRCQITLVKALGKYMEEHGNKLPTRIKMLGSNKQILSILGLDILLSEIDTAQVHKLVKKLEKRVVHYRKGDQPIAERTINDHIAHLRAVMRRARTLWNVACDPAAILWQGENGVMLSEPDYKRRPVKDDDEEERLWLALEEDTRAIYEFSLLAGVRQANAIDLRREQIEWDDPITNLAGIMKFRVKSKKRDRRKGGVSAAIHEVPITPRIAEILRSVWKQHDGEFVFMYRCQRNRLWTDKHGVRHLQRKGQLCPFTKSLLRDRWLEACEKAGVSGLTWHGLRARFITRLLDEGTPVHDVKEAAGHADIATTMLYVTSKPERRLAAMVRSERLAADRKAAREDARNRPDDVDVKVKVVK
jgi:integrase